MYIIFKTSIDSGECRSLWKSADITQVYKTGETSQASNYCPISILPAMCRLFERIFADGINYFLYHNIFYSAVLGKSVQLRYSYYTALIYGLRPLITNVSSKPCI